MRISQALEEGVDPFKPKFGLAGRALKKRIERVAICRICVRGQLPKVMARVGEARWRASVLGPRMRRPTSTFLRVSRRCWSASHMSQQPRNGFAQQFAMNHLINHSVIKQELGGLETLGQILAECLFDDAWSREADDGAWLRNNGVTQHRKTCAHTTRGGICKHRNIWNAALAQLGQHGGRFGHLHQRKPHLPAYARRRMH